MKPSLQLRISQSLTMTPQLQQAIRLLQLSSLELQTEIQNALDSNIMLEVDEGEEEEAYGEAVQEAAPQDERQDLELKEDIAATDISGELPVDTAWEDIYDGNLSYSAAAPANGADFYETQGNRGDSLAEHLLWQLNLTPINENDRAVAITIIDFLDKDGYLTCPLEEILPLMDDDMEVGIEELEATLRLIQSLDPPGVGARDIGECLILQLAQRDAGTAWLDEARLVVSSHMDLLASHDYNQLMKKLAVGRDELSEIIALIQSLNPRPGNQVQDESIQYIIPDVQVRKDNGRWSVELNVDAMPRLKINATYAGMIKRADNSPDNASLKEHLQEARWLIKSLRSRSETLLKVATSIVERQQSFLEHGEEAMKPLVLHDIAEELGMHESTVSRVTTNKYMHTPRGIFELKYFFSSHVSTDSGGSASSTAIRAVIRKLVGEENPLKPLSDSKIAGILGEQGINVARRTVAKYREALSIPPSNERKRLA